jgi:hypothetical protein
MDPPVAPNQTIVNESMANILKCVTCPNFQHRHVSTVFRWTVWCSNTKIFIQNAAVIALYDGSLWVTNKHLQIPKNIQICSNTLAAEVNAIIRLYTRMWFGHVSLFSLIPNYQEHSEITRSRWQNFHVLAISLSNSLWENKRTRDIHLHDFRSRGFVANTWGIWQTSIVERRLRPV